RRATCFIPRWASVESMVAGAAKPMTRARCYWPAGWRQACWGSICAVVSAAEREEPLAPFLRRADAFQRGEGGVLGGQQEVAHEGRIQHVGADAGEQRGEQAFLTQALGRDVAARAVLVQRPVGHATHAAA